MKRNLCLLLLLISVSLAAQNVAVKTNLLYDATATVNLGAEIGLSPKWTLDLSANYNGWTFNENKKWKHWLAQPEARYWLCERFNGHFIQRGRHQTAFRPLQESGGLPLRRLVCGCRPGLRLPVAAGQTVEHRGRAGPGLYPRAL